MLKHFAIQLLRIVFTIGIMLFSPIFLLLLLPIYVHRYLAAKLVKVFRSDLEKMLTTLSTNFSNDRLHSHSECFTLTIQKLKGHIPLSYFQQLFANRVVGSRFPDGTNRYPELKQYPYKWMGFFFWKPERDFNIQEHITQISQKHDEYLTHQDIRRIVQEFHAKPFAVDKSPWQIRLAYSNDPIEGKQTLFLFKIFHGMADGYSILKLIVEQLAQQDTSSNVQPRYYQRSFLENILHWTSFPVRAAYEFSSQALKILFEKSPWYAPRDNRTYSVVGMSKPIAISRIKAVRDKFGVTLTSVVHGLTSLSMKSYMMTHKLPIPEKAICILPFPMPGHPQKLRNLMTQVFTDLPLQLGPEETLHKANQTYSDVKKSTTPTFNFFMAHLLGGLYSSLCKAFVSPLIPSVLLTNFPANLDKPIVLDGFELVETSVCCGLMNFQSLGFYIVTYAESLNIMIVADDSLMSESQVQDFADLFEAELQELERLEPSKATHTQLNDEKLLSLV